MKRRAKLLLGLIPILSIAMTATLVSALSYQQDIGVSFTFNSTLRLTVPSIIFIDELAPGTASDSNVVTINILTNTINGYTLNASVGNDTTFATAGRNLVHKNTTITDKFTSVDFGSSLASNTDLTENTWGYSYSMDNGTTWANYSGLPLYSDTTNIATIKTSTTPVSSASGDNIKFKIAAKASSAMPSGEYNNVINFQLVATPIPKTLYMAYADAGKTQHNGYYKLQDMSSAICDAAEVLDEGSQMQAIDIRDNKVYWITKLRDGKCWFTQNLDHDIDKDFAYTPENTDIPANWVPDKSTYTTNNTTWDGNYSTGRFIQQSYDPGNLIWDGIPGSNNTNGTNVHYHLGNYYNWGAAVAMNDTSAYTARGQDVDRSICPAGWTLPKADSNTSVGSFSYLLDQYSQSKLDAPLYFLLSGRLVDWLEDVGSFGWWWSLAVIDDLNVLIMRVNKDGGAYLNTALYRSWGSSVRCLSR